MKAVAVLAALVWAGLVQAHPMGNFSVNHYARLEPGAKGLVLTYVLDLAELPTAELIQSWGVERDAPRAAMEAQARAQARQWAASLKVTEDGRALLGIVETSQLWSEPGVGNLPIYRIKTRIRYQAKGGRVEFEDGNYATRAGWREIVVRPVAGGAVEKASVGAEERSAELTEYPKDQEKAPPQDAKAWLEWRLNAPTVAPVESSRVAPQEPAAAPALPAEAVPVVPQIEPGHELRTGGLLAGLVLVLYGARLFTRKRYPVADGVRIVDRQ